MLFTEEDVNIILAILPPHEERIFRLRYGIGEARHTFAAIGLQLGLTAESIRRILKKANRKLVQRPEKRLQYEREQEEWEKQQRVYEQDPSSIPFDDYIYFNGEFRWTRLPYYCFYQSNFNTLGDIAKCPPFLLQNSHGLSAKGIHAVADFLRSFGVSYDFPLPPIPPKKNWREASMDAWQQAFS